MNASSPPDPAPLDDLRHIRQLMDRNTRFLSLSGLSGIGVGIVGLFSSYFAFEHWVNVNTLSYPTYEDHRRAVIEFGTQALLTLVVALTVGWFFTWRLVRRRGGQQIFNPASKRMLLALLLPLVVGAVFAGYTWWQTLELLNPQEEAFTSTRWWSCLSFWPAIMLCSYGLGLAAASRYTLRELYWLGLLQIALGFAALFWLNYGLWFWAIGFGVLHIVYGIWMYVNYDRKPA